MTDYRDINHSDLNHARDNARRYQQQSGTSVGGILIALALIAIVFLGLSLMFSGTGSDRPTAPVINDTTSQPVTPPTTTTD